MIKLILVLISALSISVWATEDSKLVKAVHEGSVSEVTALAKNPTELNWKDSAGFDALFYAVSLNDLEKTQALLASGASTKGLYTAKKESLLFEAARLGSEPVLSALIKKDSSLLKVKNIDAESSLFEAVRQDQSELVKLLVKKGLSLKDKNKAGKTPAQFVDPKNKKMTALFKELKSAK